VVAEILVEVGETVDVGTVIARLAVEDAAVVAAPPENGRRYSPVVRRMADAHGLDLSQVPGTGLNGRVTKRDVEAHMRAPEDRPLHSESPYRPDPEPAAPSVAAPDGLGGVAAPLSRMRRAIGTAMRRSQETAATCHTMVECDMSRVEARRRELGITALPLVARAVVETLRDFPELNATLDGTTITRFERVHVGIAVSLGADGLIVPVIRDAQDLSAEGLAGRIKDVARRARAQQLEPDEVQGATFTITNPGAAGAVFATPIINVPQVAILDLEAIVRRPVVITDADGNESIAIRPMVNLILGWDHRALDGIYAAQFLTALRRRLESGR
jgi:pyruvate/2-oxoglutarate dehydrogenase complex dihydrolipoamide acyltransferase (E2) component